MLQARFSTLVALFVGALVCTSAWAQPLIGLNWSTAGSTVPDPQNWTRVSAPDGLLTNLQDDTGAPTGVNMAFGGGASGGFVYLGTSTLGANAVPQHSYSLAGMTGYGFRSNGEFFVEFSGLSPSTPYEYWFVAYRSTSAIQNVVNVSDGDVPNAVTFIQSITSAANDGRFIINETISHDSQVFESLARTSNSSSTGTLRFEWMGSGQTTVIGALAIREVPEPSALAALLAAPMLLVRRRR